MAWCVELHPRFAKELAKLGIVVQDEIFALAKALQHLGPHMKRPRSDTLNGSKHRNMKELRFDADGGVWVCLFAGSTVRRYRPDGTIDRQIELPLTNPTCPGFGGEDLRTLYITTARHRLTEQQLAAEPDAGALLQLDVGVAGLRTNRFAG